MYFTKLSVTGFSMQKKIKGVVKMKGYKNLRSMKKWVNMVGKQGENQYKMLKASFSLRCMIFFLNFQINHII